MSVINQGDKHGKNYIAICTSSARGHLRPLVDDIDINYVICPSVVYDNATRLNTVRNACILFHIRLFDNASNERKQK